MEPLPVMMLAHEELRTVPLTIHVPDQGCSRADFAEELILETLRVMARDLTSRFGIAAAADCGGRAQSACWRRWGHRAGRDRDYHSGAGEGAGGEGIDAVGPLPGDTLFFPKHWRQYDAVLAMYHDQALIPIKTVAFDAGVNVTLGLPIVRTSPDHGTAFDLAGTGRSLDIELFGGQ